MSENALDQADIPALLELIAEIRAERDLARSAAVALEQELALKDEALDQIRALHKAESLFIGSQHFVVCDAHGACETQRVLSSLASRLEDQQ